jgi:exocyst complex component 4
MAGQFDVLLKTYDHLSELILCTLRIDVRCRVIHFLNLAMRQGNYRVDHETFEPEPHIIDLNSELSAYDDVIASTLPERERRFVFEGLGSMVEHLLVYNARYIRFANKFGIQKIMRNILAVQQSLKTLSDAPQDAEFERAKTFYDMFSLTPSQMLEQVQQKPRFTFDEYRSMLNLQCGVDQLAERPAGGSDYNMHLMELHALAIDDMDDES